MGTLGGVGVCVRDIPLVPHRGNHYLCLNHFIFPMDILKKELTSIYARQNLSSKHLSTLVVDECRHIVETSAAVEDDCRVITDAATDTCHIFGGAFARLIGMGSDRIPFSLHADSGDEDIIYTRIHPEDLVDKRMLEYEFFKLVDKMPSETKCDFRACCRIRIKGCGEIYLRRQHDQDTKALPGRDDMADSMHIQSITLSVTRSRHQSRHNRHRLRRRGRGGAVEKKRPDTHSTGKGNIKSHT